MAVVSCLVPLLFAVLISTAFVRCADNGPIRLWRNGTSLPNFSSGRVQVYVLYTWGNICSDGFDGNSSDVICHQLGYTGAASFSDSSRDNYGTDNSSTVLTSVGCSDSQFLVILQCNYIRGSACLSSHDVSVECYSSRIWDNPYNGQVRLTGGDTVNEGLVEIYCNGQWGTVCDDSFGSTEADTVCRQLGYTFAFKRNHLSIQGATSQPIWLGGLSCSSTYNCVTNCQSCPQTKIKNCTHVKDVTVECYSRPLQFQTTTSTCINDHEETPSPLNVSAVSGGVVVGVLVLVVLVVILVVGFKCRKRHSRKNAPVISNITLSSTSYSARPVSRPPQQATPSFGLPRQAPTSFGLPQQAPPSFGFSQAPPTSIFTYSEPTDPTITEAPPPTYGQHDNFATYTGPSDEKSKQPPPYPNPPPQAFTPSAPPPPDHSPYPSGWNPAIYPSFDPR